MPTIDRVTEPPTTSTRRRFGFALLAYSFAAIMLGTTLPTPIYALYAERMHFSVLTTTVIFSTYAVGVLTALLVFGRWSDALGRRPVLLAGAGFALGSAVVFLFADDVPLLLVGRLLSGLSAGIFTGTATAAIVEASPADRRAEVSSTYFVVAYVAIAVPVVGEGFASQHLGLSTAGVSFAIATAVLAAIWLAAIVVQERRSRVG